MKGSFEPRTAKWAIISFSKISTIGACTNGAWVALQLWSRLSKLLYDIMKRQKPPRSYFLKIAQAGGQTWDRLFVFSHKQRPKSTRTSSQLKLLLIFYDLMGLRPKQSDRRVPYVGLFPPSLRAHAHTECLMIKSHKDLFLILPLIGVWLWTYLALTSTLSQSYL